MLSTAWLLNQQKVILFNLKQHLFWSECKHWDSLIHSADCYSYLGLIFRKVVDYSITIKAVAAQASRALGLAIDKCKILGGVEYHIFTYVWDSIVFLIIEGETGIWGYTTLQRYNIEHYT